VSSRRPPRIDEITIAIFTTALIGGAAGAVLGAAFGGGVKGTLITGAAGAGIGAIIGKSAQDNRQNNYYRH